MNSSWSWLCILHIIGQKAARVCVRARVYAHLVLWHDEYENVKKSLAFFFIFHYHSLACFTHSMPTTSFSYRGCDFNLYFTILENLHCLPACLSHCVIIDAHWRCAKFSTHSIFAYLSFRFVSFFLLFWAHVRAKLIHLLYRFVLE